MWDRRYKSRLISLSMSPTSQLTSVYCFKFKFKFTFLQIIAPYYLESVVISEPVAKYLLATIIFFSNLIIDISHMVGKK